MDEHIEYATIRKVTDPVSGVTGAAL